MHVVALPPAGVVWNYMRHTNTGTGHSFSLRLGTLRRKSCPLLDQPTGYFLEVGVASKEAAEVRVQQHRRLRELEQKRLCWQRTPAQARHHVPISHLLIGRGRKHLFLMGVLGEVKRVGHHQVAPVQAG